mmetsp:Transcript_30815/g.102634  ORF Transcript_30815/g.102634 Transcript_30815/m.102634 type:complete len:355 (-) Transcript_30815:1516-2580(-)
MRSPRRRPARSAACSRSRPRPSVRRAASRAARSPRRRRRRRRRRRWAAGACRRASSSSGSSLRPCCWCGWASSGSEVAAALWRTTASWGTPLLPPSAEAAAADPSAPARPRRSRTRRMRRERGNRIGTLAVRPRAGTSLRVPRLRRPPCRRPLARCLQGQASRRRPHSGETPTARHSRAREPKALLAMWRTGPRRPHRPRRSPRHRPRPRRHPPLRPTRRRRRPWSRRSGRRPPASPSPKTQRLRRQRRSAHWGRCQWNLVGSRMSSPATTRTSRTYGSVLLGGGDSRRPMRWPRRQLRPWRASAVPSCHRRRRRRLVALGETTLGRGSVGQVGGYSATESLVVWRRPFLYGGG